MASRKNTLCILLTVLASTRFLSTLALPDARVEFSNKGAENDDKPSDTSRTTEGTSTEVPDSISVETTFPKSVSQRLSTNDSTTTTTRYTISTDGRSRTSEEASQSQENTPTAKSTIATRQSTHPKIITTEVSTATLQTSTSGSSPGSQTTEGNPTTLTFSSKVTHVKTVPTTETTLETATTKLGTSTPKEGVTTENARSSISSVYWTTQSNTISKLMTSTVFMTTDLFTDPSSEVSTAPSTIATTTKSPKRKRKFDAASFVGGLTLGFVLCLICVILLFFCMKRQQDVPYIKFYPSSRNKSV